MREYTIKVEDHHDEDASDELIGRATSEVARIFMEDYSAVVKVTLTDENGRVLTFDNTDSMEEDLCP